MIQRRARAYYDAWVALLPRTKAAALEELLGGQTDSIGQCDGVEVVVPAAILRRAPGLANPVDRALALRPPRGRGRLDFVQLWVLRWGLVNMVGMSTSERASRVSAEKRRQRREEIVTALGRALRRFLRAFPPGLPRLSEEDASTPTALEAVVLAEQLERLLANPLGFDRRRLAEADTYGARLVRRVWAPLVGRIDTRTQDATWFAVAAMRAGLSTARDLALVAALERNAFGQGGALLNAKTVKQRSAAVDFWNGRIARARDLLAAPT